MNTLWIVDLEPLDNRYTKQWQTHIPELATKNVGSLYNIVNISGTATAYDKPQKGAFFNFAGTCEYKASQASQIAVLFNEKKVQPGDVFFFTDAWNQTVHSVKYMSELLNIPVKIAGIWHAGWYDPTDILGVQITNREWARTMEESMFHAIDWNFFGTHHNANIFLRTHETLKTSHYPVLDKIFVGGAYPLEYIANLVNTKMKENIVVFPHRLNFDKAPHVFDAIRTYVHDEMHRKDIMFFKTQEQDLSKDGYYDFLKRCKVVFSANKHENLGIGTFEAMTAGCIPVVPNKLSYAEMYSDQFKYDCPESLYDLNPVDIASVSKKIVESIDQYDVLNSTRAANVESIQSKFFTAWHIFDVLTEHANETTITA